MTIQNHWAVVGLELPAASFHNKSGKEYGSLPLIYRMMSPLILLKSILTLLRHILLTGKYGYIHISEN